MTGGLPGWMAARRRRRPLAHDPFAALGLDAGTHLTGDDVRAAWRRIAAATHPDRADGGDPARFAAAAAAYTELRTGFGRGEALADVTLAAVRRRGWAGLTARVAGGRPARLALRIAAATAAGTAGVLAAGGGPAGPALATGALTWLVLTIRRDLGPPG